MYFQDDEGYILSHSHDSATPNMHFDEEESNWMNNQDENFRQLIEKEYERMASEHSIVNDCILPTITQGIQSVWILILLCLAIRCLSLTKINAKILNFVSATAGLIALWHFYENLSVYVVILAIVGYICIAMKRRINGTFLSAVSVIYMLFCEKIFVKELEWNRIRGSVMVVAMKLISIGFDYENGNIWADMDLLSYYGYILNPASVIFGPFITFKDYLQLFNGNIVSLSWIGNVLKTICFSAVCLSWSTCGTTNIFSSFGSSRWTDAYKDASGFRFSTYFVSYLSEAMCLISGIGTVCVRRNDIDNLRKEKWNCNEVFNIPSDSAVTHDSKNSLKSESSKCHENSNEVTLFWRRPVSVPFAVELPRSLVEVVTNWNLPMHYWLKTYVFKTSRHFGVFPAILITYFASSLLHGLNFQLSVILFSIGVFAYIENGIRKTLSTLFDACIEARKCRQNCTHQYKKNNFLVACTNIAFGLIAVWNLTYLGCLFDNDAEVQETGYSLAHALKKWAKLGYICHYVMMGVFIINKLIKDGFLFSLPQWPRRGRRE